MMGLQHWFGDRPVLAERASMALMRRIDLSGARWPEFSIRPRWERDTGYVDRADHRFPPMPGKARVLGPGTHRNVCPVCCQPTYAGGDWREDAGKPRWNKDWHACCYWAHSVWKNSTWWAAYLARRQGGICAVTRAPLMRDGVLSGDVEVDHVIPLWRIATEPDRHAWPDVLKFWGISNLQLLSRAAHLAKSSREAAERASLKRDGVVLP